MLVAMLIDAYVDRLFAAQAEPDDILAYRAELAAAVPALGLLMALCAGREGVALVTEDVAVPLADYGRLGLEDFMVSLYNEQKVQRLRLALADGGRRDMLETLQAALEGLPDATGGGRSTLLPL